MLSAAVDLPLMVLPPIWVLLLVFALTSFTGDRVINDWVASLGAVGHHLPGMLRAYGDRALLRRFRTRFIVAPLVLVLMCYQATYSGVQTVVVIAFVWGVWHALAQSYGFARIYAVKAGCGDRPSALVDQALLVTSFLTALVWSPLRLGFLLDKLAACGAGLPSAAGVAALQWGTLGLVGVALAAWLVVVARAARAGRGPGWVRVLLLVTSIGFWWFANVRVTHLLLAAPLFELFHDAQYLTIVWIFNRRRVDSARPDDATGFLPSVAALFRPRAISIVGYVGVCAAYGYLAFYAAKPQLPGQPDSAGAEFSRLLTSLVAASQLLHFYYDGFIWKVREPQIAGVLGVSGPQGRRALFEGVSWPARRHALLWAVLLVGYAGFWLGEREGEMPMPARLLAVSDLVPDNTILRFPASEIRWKRGERETALAGFRAVLAADPSLGHVRRNLAISLVELADERFQADDRLGLGPLARELADLRAVLDAETGAFVDERLAAYRTPK